MCVCEWCVCEWCVCEWCVCVSGVCVCVCVSGMFVCVSMCMPMCLADVIGLFCMCTINQLVSSSCSGGESDMEEVNQCQSNIPNNSSALHLKRNKTTPNATQH